MTPTYSTCSAAPSVWVSQIRPLSERTNSAMTTEKEPCPLCLAAAADWCEDPHSSGWTPWRSMEDAPRGELVWLLCSNGKEYQAYHHKNALWRVNGENGSVVDITQAPQTQAIAALRWRHA